MRQVTENAAERRRHIVQIAAEIFLRRGFARTSLLEIAQAAGLSRPTLYASFPDKAGLFRAVIETMVARKLDELRQGLTERSGFQAKLGFLCESWSLEGFELVQANPDAKDMFDLKFEVVQESHAAFEALLSDFLGEALGETSLPYSAEALATMISAAMSGFKQRSQDSRQLSESIRCVMDVVTQALGKGSPL